jgi:hypothetical protein
MIFVFRGISRHCRQSTCICIPIMTGTIGLRAQDTIMNTIIQALGHPGLSYMSLADNKY